MSSCENSLEMTLPQGPEGPQGPAGKSAFELWIEYYQKDPNTTIEEFYNSLRGKDGVDGNDGDVPVIGSNGNWYIGGVDTKIPARGKDGINGQDGVDGITPKIGDNGNWFIGETDTKIPAKGDKGDKGDGGIEGKSAYQLWKDHLGENCDGTVKDKDGKPHDCEADSWEDFLIWLQGGNTSVLHEYWKTIPGNENKDLNVFIEELFDCHCDGITVSVIALDDCVELDKDGKTVNTIDARLRVGGKKGTSVLVEGTGINLNGTIDDANTPIAFLIPRGDESIQLTIICTESGNNITKKAVIPALKYIKITGSPSITATPNGKEDAVLIKFEKEPEELYVDEVLVYSKAKGIVDGSEWTVSTNKKIFSKEFTRKATEQTPTIKAKGSDDECTILKGLIKIPTLTPVTLDNLSLNTLNDCDLNLTFQGTPGMGVVASFLDIKPEPAKIVVSETSSGKYSATFPRLYTAYRIALIASKDGYGTVMDTISVNGTNLAPVNDPITIETVPTDVDNVSKGYYRRQITNMTNGDLDINLSINGNTTGLKIVDQSIVMPSNIKLSKGETKILSIPKYYLETLGSGTLYIKVEVTTECKLTKVYYPPFPYQSGYGYKFTVIGGDNGTDVTIRTEIFSGIPNSYIELQLNLDAGYSAVLRKQLDNKGYMTHDVTLTKAQYDKALEKGLNNEDPVAFFRFFKDSGYNETYSIGVDKEKVKFEVNK